MVKAKYWCKDCKYVWRTKKDIGRPSNCPRCSSKRIVYDTLMNNQLGFSIGLTGLVMFIIGYKDSSSSSNLFMMIGLLGILVLVGTIFNSYDEHYRNKRILKQFSND